MTGDEATRNGIRRLLAVDHDTTKQSGDVRHIGEPAKEFGFARKTLHQYRRMPALENVQRLLFKENLFVFQQILGQAAVLVCYPHHLVS